MSCGSRSGRNSFPLFKTIGGKKLTQRTRHTAEVIDPQRIRRTGTISALLEKAEEKMKTSDTKSEKQKEIVNVKVAMGWTVGEIF